MIFKDINMECMKQNKSYLYDKFKEVDFSSLNLKIDKIESINSRDGEKLVVIQLDSREYRLNSIYRPIDEAKRWIEQYEFNSAYTIITMFGFGNGVFARQIIENMSDTDILLIYEPSIEIFMHVINNYDLTDIFSNKRVSISVEGLNEFEFHSCLRDMVNISNIKNQKNLIYPQYDKIFVESCINFYKELKNGYHHAKININSEKKFAKKSIENILNNIQFLENSNTLSQIREIIPANLPAVIVAAGPSLEDNIEELKKLKEKVIILAVDRTIDYLLDSGIEPDFLVTLDPMKLLKDYSRRTDLAVPLICIMESNYEILSRHKGRKIIGNCTRFLDEIYQQKKVAPPRILTSGSVATIAFSACLEMGIKRIILVGQDLAYRNNKTHMNEEIQDQEFNPLTDVMIEGIESNKVRSRYDWKEFLNWFQDMIVLNPDIEVIDVKSSGAMIKGTTLMSLADVANKYCKQVFFCKEAMDNLNVTFNSEDINKLYNYLNKNISILEGMRKKAQEAIKSCRTLIEEENKNNASMFKIEKEVKNLKKANRYIERQSIYKIMDPFINAQATSQLSEIYQFSNDLKENSINTYKKSISIYEAVIEAVDYVMPLIENTIKKQTK